MRRVRGAEVAHVACFASALIRAGEDGLAHKHISTSSQW